MTVRPGSGADGSTDRLRRAEEAQMEETTLLDAYLSGPGILRAAVSGLTREQMVSRPVAGKWSVLEVVCHLADTDANIAHRIKRVLSEERPVFDRVQPELMRAALAYHDRDIEEELCLFDLTRRQVGRILRASPPEAWERTGIVGDRGNRSVDQMINGAIEHLAHHLRFVIEKRHALSFDSQRSSANLP
jgi:uncharacterized damage-inducible protein DinB